MSRGQSDSHERQARAADTLLHDVGTQKEEGTQAPPGPQARCGSSERGRNRKARLAARHQTFGAGSGFESCLPELANATVSRTVVLSETGGRRWRFSCGRPEFLLPVSHAVTRSDPGCARTRDLPPGGAFGCRPLHRQNRRSLPTAHFSLCSRRLVCRRGKRHCRQRLRPAAARALGGCAFPRASTRARTRSRAPLASSPGEVSPRETCRPATNHTRNTTSPAQQGRAPTAGTHPPAYSRASISASPERPPYLISLSPQPSHYLNALAVLLS